MGRPLLTARSEWRRSGSSDGAIPRYRIASHAAVPPRAAGYCVVPAIQWVASLEPGSPAALLLPCGVGPLMPAVSKNAGDNSFATVAIARAPASAPAKRPKQVPQGQAVSALLVAREPVSSRLLGHHFVRAYLPTLRARPMVDARYPLPPSLRSTRVVSSSSRSRSASSRTAA